MDGAGLDARLLDAHARREGRALVALYAEAAGAAPDPDAAAFYLTHAWIWALDTGSPEAEALRRRLAAEGRV